MSLNSAAGAAYGSWNVVGRSVVFMLGATSIACLLLDFYGWGSLGSSVRCLLVPAVGVLLALAAFDRFRGDGRLCRAVVIGLAGGLMAAVAYDVFRLPFVFARQWGLARVVPAMDLFKVFPRFGARILSQPLEQSSYALWARVIGWLYHFSNGAGFGLMYVAMIGDGKRRHWAWAVLMALALELGMLLTPYPQVFHIAVTPRFVAVTAAAHAIFGVILGLFVSLLWRRVTPGASAA